MSGENTALFFDMIDQGYEPVSAIEDFVFVDMEIAINSKCPLCETGCYYEGYTIGGNLNVSYRAFYVCPKCGHYEEF